MKTQTTRLAAILTLLAAIASPAAVKATEIMPDFGLTVPASWVTDRYDPTSFSNVGIFAGRSDVLGIGITSAGNLANRPGGQQTSFYNTQGRQHAVVGGAGSTVSADVWVDSSWSNAANGSVRTDMWGVMTDAALVPAVTAYPILGFTNYGGVARFRYYDADTNAGWVDLAATVQYGAWNSLSIGFTGSSLDYSVNGALVGTDVTINGSAGFSAVIMQAYNFADPSISGATLNDYTAHWANANVPDAGNTVTMLGAAVLGLAVLRRRKIM